MNGDFLVMPGGAMKSLSDSGKVGGYLVLFGSDNVDLQDEYYHPNCDFWLEGKSLLPLIFDHGRSLIFKRKKLTHVRWETQSKGLWIEGKLPINESAKIEQLWEAVKADQLGLSSGTSGHLAERVQRGRFTEILTWPISEASLCERPAQPKSRAVALKSLPEADFELLARSSNVSAEQRAGEIYVQCIMRGHELKMKEIEQSLHTEARTEETDYYGTLAKLAYQEHLERMRNLKR